MASSLPLPSSSAASAAASKHKPRVADFNTPLFASTALPSNTLPQKQPHHNQQQLDPPITESFRLALAHFSAAADASLSSSLENERDSHLDPDKPRSLDSPVDSSPNLFASLSPTMQKLVEPVPQHISTKPNNNNNNNNNNIPASADNKKASEEKHQTTDHHQADVDDDSENQDQDQDNYDTDDDDDAYSIEADAPPRLPTDGGGDIEFTPMAQLSLDAPSSSAQKKSHASLPQNPSSSIPVPTKLQESVQKKEPESKPEMKISTQPPATIRSKPITETANKPKHRTKRGATTRNDGDAPAWLISPETKRKCVACQVFFIDYYYDLLSYLHARKTRLAEFRDYVSKNALSPEEEATEYRRLLGKERAYLRKRRTRTTVSQFQKLTQIGQGGYGQVFLAVKKDSREICAIKVMNKKLLAKLDEVHHILTERDVLMSARSSPWLVKLLYAFQDPSNVYLAMEFVPGGDVRTLIGMTGLMREEHARFYTAEMVLAVDALHSLGYIHRDLKPENFLIDAQGHLKLTDFGLSKGQLCEERMESMRMKLEGVKHQKLIHRTVSERRTMHRGNLNTTRAITLVGSADYMAPEILGGQGYDFRVDYWSIGCILYEFLAGFPPFAGKSTEEVWRNVLSWDKVLQRPQYDLPEDQEFNLTDAAWDIITQLINKADKRYHTVKQVVVHEWFQGMDFVNVRTTEKPPFIPRLKNATDVRYFDDFDNPEDMKLYEDVRRQNEEHHSQIPTMDSVRGGVSLRRKFVGFTYRRRAGPESAESWNHA